MLSHEKGEQKISRSQDDNLAFEWNIPAKSDVDMSKRDDVGPDFFIQVNFNDNTEDRGRMDWREDSLSKSNNGFDKQRWSVGLDP